MADQEREEGRLAPPSGSLREALKRLDDLESANRALRGQVDALETRLEVLLSSPHPATVGSRNQPLRELWMESEESSVGSTVKLNDRGTGLLVVRNS